MKTMLVAAQHQWLHCTSPNHLVTFGDRQHVASRCRKNTATAAVSKEPHNRVAVCYVAAQHTGTVDAGCVAGLAARRSCEIRLSRPW